MGLKFPKTFNYVNFYFLEEVEAVLNSFQVIASVTLSLQSMRSRSPEHSENVTTGKNASRDIWRTKFPTVNE